MSNNRNSQGEKTIKQVFSIHLRAKRKEEGLTLAQAAERVKLSEKQYGNLERGLCAPSAETFVRIYREFGISLYEMDVDLPDKE